MTHFKDLSRYSYGCREWRTRNVGWLSVAKPFSKGQTPTGFADALAICAIRRTELTRGSHRCDLCELDGVSPPASSYCLSGRTVGLGNGEIRVPDKGGRIFSAPTLVVHYVAEHSYLPPEDFISSIFQVAESSYVVHGPEYAVISSLSVSKKYALCVESVAAVCREPWVKSAVHLLRTATDSLTTPVESESRNSAISALEKLLPEQPAASDSRFLVYCAKWFLLYSDNEYDVEMATNRVAMAIERASDMGLGVDLIQELIKDAKASA